MRWKLKMIISKSYLIVRTSYRRNRPVVLVTLFLLLVAAGLAGTVAFARKASASTLSPAARLNGRIAFRNDNWIYSINPNGTDEKVLSTVGGTSGVQDHNASWSPDGSKIAFSRRLLAGPDSAIWIMNADGTNQHQVGANSGDTQPTWSPDGAKIAFVRNVNKGDIFVMNAADGSDAHSIAGTAEYELDPAWSPDGSHIAFTSSRDFPGAVGNIATAFEIYSVPVDIGGNPTSSPVRLTNNTAVDGAPSWSPDSSRLAFLSQRDNLPVVYTMDADGANQQNLMNSTTDDSANPVWSPDGTQIAFTNYSRVPHSNTDEIYSFSLQRGAVGRITNTVYDEHELSWQSLPDGTPTPTPTPTPSPTPIAYTNYRISGSVVDSMGAPIPGVEISFVGEVNTQPVILETNAAGIFFYNYPADFSMTVRPSKNGYVFNPTFVKAVSSGSLSGDFGMHFTGTAVVGPPFSGISIPAASSTLESLGKAQVTISRVGDTSRPATLKYQTASETASQKSDYTFVSGTLRFAANETSKTISVPVTDDNSPEENETFKIEYDSGLLGLGGSTTVTIIDNDSGQPTTNPADVAQFFVRQHYHDFLGRTADQGGLDYWTSQINQCDNETDPQLHEKCVQNQRIGVSAAFFIELEFQDTGFFVYRLYKAALGRRPTYQEFVSDRNKVIGGARLEASKQSLAYEFAQRPEFTQFYALDFNSDFVNRLFDTAGLTPFTNERQQALTAMNAGRTRAQVLRDVIEMAAIKDREYKPAFVSMQYFGYLRRNPDQAGFDFWLDVLNRLPEPNNYRGMVCAFITSDEYQNRFSSVSTHSNAECGQ
jgi:Tol biopolymer transport system component